jgi:hypothetical protein
MKRRRCAFGAAHYQRGAGGKRPLFDYRYQFIPSIYLVSG